MTIDPELEPAGLLEPFELTADVFTRMIEAGLIPEKRRVFLLDGRLYEKRPETLGEASVGAGVTRAVVRRLPDAWSLWPHSTVILDPTNVSVPDFAIIRSGELLGRVDPDRYPEPRDIAILIEVAVSSLRADLTISLELYARTKIPAYWVIDVKGRRVLVHTEPRLGDGGRGEYGRVETFGPGQEIPIVLDGREVARVPFDDLLR